MKTSVTALVLLICCLGFSQVGSTQFHRYFSHFWYFDWFFKALFEDVRCICICPDTAVVNGTQSHRQSYIDNVPPNKCDCVNVILPQVGDDIKIKEKEFCPLCECKYESRNTTTIKVWPPSAFTICLKFLNSTYNKNFTLHRS